MKRKILSLTALLFSIYAQAQEQNKTSLAVGETAVVTATKTPTKQNETGKVVSVITKEEIEKNSAKTLGQLLNAQVGVTIAGALNNLGSNQTVYMRGASLGRVLILLDGVPVSDPSLIANDFDLNLFSLANVERIEVCRGAQSTLYGSDAVAGVINITTNKTNVSKPFNVAAGISAGSFNTLKSNVQLFGKYNKLSYTVTAANVSSKGFSSAYDSTGNKNFDNDKYNGTQLSAVLKYQLAENLTAKAFAQNTKYSNSLDAAIFNDEKDYSVKNNSVIAGTGFNYNTKNVQLNGTYQYSDIKRNYINDSIDKPGFVNFSTDDYYGKNQFLELYSNINLGKGFTILHGADYRFSNMNSKYYSLSFFGPYTAITKDSIQSQASAYSSLFYQSTNKKLNLELGGRMNVHSRYGNNNTFTFNPSYQINSLWRVFGSIASGFKAPTLYQLYSSYGNLNLQPEKSKSYDLGVQFENKNVYTRAVYFSRKIDNAIDFNNINFQYFNIIKQNVNGIELEAKINPTTKLSIAANYTYLKASENSQSRQTFKDTAYTYLLRRPNGNFNVNIGYQITEKAFVSISSKAVSKRFDVGGYKAKDVELKSYLLLGAYAEYHFNKKLNCFVDAQNITNTKFFDIRGFNSMPTMLQVGVRFNW
jgi:vitamin B12 transporter